MLLPRGISSFPMRTALELADLALCRHVTSCSQITDQKSWDNVLITCNCYVNDRRFHSNRHVISPPCITYGLFVWSWVYSKGFKSSRLRDMCSSGSRARSEVRPEVRSVRSVGPGQSTATASRPHVVHPPNPLMTGPDSVHHAGRQSQASSKWTGHSFILRQRREVHLHIIMVLFVQAHLHFPS